MTAESKCSGEQRCGVVALIGRPNSGKSTLLNTLIGEKIAIVSDKPQTTRTRISGVLTLPEGQIVFVDTPGIHRPGYGLNRRMMSIVVEALTSVDLILLMVDSTAATGSGDRFVLDLLKRVETPAFLVPNKVDALRDKSILLPLIEFHANERRFDEVIPISALRADGTAMLVDRVMARLPVGPPLYPDDALTDQPERFLVAELVREKILSETEAEIPYVTAVVIERWEDTPGLTRILGLIYVERRSHRAIIIGRNGQRIKQIGSAARREIETLLGRRVYLELFVKVREHWRNDERALDELGIGGR